MERTIIARPPEDSPQVTQEVASPAKNGFPKSNGEFLRYLFLGKSPAEVGIEIQMASLDYVMGEIERVQLRFSSIFRGYDTPKGHGKVVIATGFGTHPSWYLDTATFFSRLGYEAIIYDSNSHFNVRPVEQQVNDFMDFLLDQGEGLKIFAHSKGGLLSVATYATHRDEFTSVVRQAAIIAAPRPEWVNCAIGLPYYLTQWRFKGDDFRFAAEVLDNSDIENIDGVLVTAVGNPRDPIIRGRLVGRPDEQFTTDSSHSGMYTNVEVLSLVAHRFADPDAVVAKAA